MRNVISWKYTLKTQVSIYKTLEIDYIMDRNVNSLIIIKTFLIQQAGMCNGSLEKGQIDPILPILSTIGVNKPKLADINCIKLYIFLNVSGFSTI